jgi:hypothetical protein
MYCITFKALHMTDNKTDNQDYLSTSDDKERDMAAKGGPMTAPGIPDSKHGISQPYNEDTQTQLAAKSTENKNKDEKEKNNDNTSGM